MALADARRRALVRLLFLAPQYQLSMMTFLTEDAHNNSQ